jgi:hypothetical protein
VEKFCKQRELLDGHNWDHYFQRTSTGMVYKIVIDYKGFIALENPIEYTTIAQKYTVDAQLKYTCDVDIKNKMETFLYILFWKPYKCVYGCIDDTYHAHGN